MKATFIFNNKPDIVFVKLDKAFSCHVKRTATTEGLMENEGEDDEVDPNIILQLYSPLVASQRFMIGQACNPYNKIITKNGFTIVVKQFSDYMFIAINGDGHESADFLHRQLLVLNQIIVFLYGPCIEEIRPDKLKERKVRWKLISDYLQTWLNLYHTEQSFLVEAVERLHVNQMLSSLAIQLLEKTLLTAQSHGEKHATHAMLISSSKLLSLYAIRNAAALKSSDQMMIILLVNMLFANDGTASHRFCSLTSREPNLRSSVSIPHKIGSSVASRSHSKAHYDGLHEDSSSELEDNVGSSDQVRSDSSDEEIVKSFSNVKSSSKNKLMEFPDITETQSLRLTKTPIVDSGRSTSMSRDAVSYKSQSDITAAGQTLTQSASYPTLPSHVITQQSSAASTLPCIVVSGSDATSQTFHQSANNDSHTDTHIKDNSHASSQSHGRDFNLKQRNTSSDQLRFKALQHQGRMSSMPALPHVSTDLHSNNQSDHHLPVHNLRSSKSQSELSWMTQTSSDEGLNKYYSTNVMLRKGDVDNVPHVIHCVRVMHGVYLVIISERTKVQYAHIINHMASTIQAVLSSADTHATPKQTQDSVDSSVKKLGDLLKKSKVT